MQQIARHNLFFKKKKKISEVDFVMQYGTDIVPIEVKSGTNVKAKSLKQFREKYLPKISIRFSLKETKFDDNLLNISLYHSPFFDFLLDYSYKKCVK
jgi:predicted AAA+ superfamily ATPase